MPFINSESKTFYKLIKENGFELVVPDYQREFEWDDENFLFLLSEITEIENSQKAWKSSYNNDDDIFSFDEKSTNFRGQQLFLGNIVMQNNNIVDGQQRLTSIMVIMKALSDIFEDMDKEKILRKEFISEISNKYKQKKGNKFVPLINSKVITSNKKITASQVNIKFVENNLGKNYKIFKLYNKTVKYFKEIKNLSEIIDIISFRILTIQFIEMKIDDLEQAFDIFEKLNSTSVPLSPSDLIKNKLISKFHTENNFLENKSIKEILKEIMNNLTNEKGNTLDPTTFYRTALMIKNAYDPNIEEKKTYIVKNKLYKNQFEDQTNDNLREKIKFIYKISIVYNKYFVNNNVNSLYKNLAYRFLDMKKTVVLSTLTIYFCKLKDDRKISNFDWYKLVKWVENYFIGMFTISNNPSKEVDKLIPVLIYRINNLKKAFNYKNILDIIRPPLIGEFPETDRKNVYKNLKNITLKNTQAIQILNKLYDEIDFTKKDFKIKDKNFNNLKHSVINNDYSSLEHFLPQNTSKWREKEEWRELIDLSSSSSSKPNSNDKIYKYIYSIGNMFILHKNNNSGLGNDSFENKKEKLTNNNDYHLSKDIFNELLIIENNLNDLESWSKENIDSRSNKIIKILKENNLLDVN